MRELLRNSEGTITRAEFRKGALFLLVITFGIMGLFLGVGYLSKSMSWMTVSIAPFLGVIVFLVVCSLIYFWFCIFIKRFNGLGFSQNWIYAWLGAMVVASVGRLLDYQFETLHISGNVLLANASLIAIVFSVIAVALFGYMLVMGWGGHERK